MFTRSPLRRVLTVLTVSMVGLAPALVVAPAAHAAGSALTSTSPTAFGDVPVGQVARPGRHCHQHRRLTFIDEHGE